VRICAYGLRSDLHCDVDIARAHEAVADARSEAIVFYNLPPVGRPVSLLPPAPIKNTVFPENITTPARLLTAAPFG
jgi:hypothetical protein